MAITVHNYRWRLGLAKCEARYDALEEKIGTFPSIGVPTITMEGDANGRHADAGAYGRRFTG